MGAHYHHMLERQRGDGVDDLAASLRAFINPVKFPLAPQQELSCDSSACVEVLGKADSSAEDVGARVLGGVGPGFIDPRDHITCFVLLKLRCPVHQVNSIRPPGHRIDYLTCGHRKAGGNQCCANGIQRHHQLLREQKFQLPGTVRPILQQHPLDYP